MGPFKFIDTEYFYNFGRKLRRIKYNLLVISLLILLCVSVIVSYLHSYYNWDVDHEIYYGQQLIDGNLIWVKEFHDKLPFLQLIFAVSSVFGGIQAWRTISWISVFLTSTIFYFALPKLMKNLVVEFKQKKKISLIFAFAFPIWIFNLPDDVSHINALAVSLFTSATLILLVVKEGNIGYVATHRTKAIIFIVFLFSASISIRPYLLAPVLAYLYYLAFQGSYSKFTNTLKTPIIRFSQYMALLLLFGFALNILPYIVLNQFSFFVTGLKMNILIDWNTNSALTDILASLSQRNSSIFWICFILTLVVSIRTSIQKQIFPHSILIHYLALIGLIFNIAFVHWWPHYLSFFCGFLLIITFSNLNHALSLKFGSYPIKRIKIPEFHLYVLILLIALMFTNALAKSGAIVYREINQIEPERYGELNAYSEYITSRKFENYSFLAPDNMYMHWKLHEPRHGFPGAAPTYSIVRNLWIKKPRLNEFDFINSAEQYCSRIEDSNIDFIVVKDTNLIPGKCFVPEKSKYVLKDSLRIKKSAKYLLIYSNSETVR